MLLLAIDTSGSDGSIALARGNPDGTCDVLEVVPLAGGTFSPQLVPQVAELLSKYNFSKQNIQGFAVASGPGSFTGLRVGLAAVKALAEVLHKPIATVSVLEAVLQAGVSGEKVMAALDAGRGEIYVGFANEDRIVTGQELVTLEKLVAMSGGLTVITPDKVVADAARAKGLTVEVVQRPRSDSIAGLGWRKILAGKTVPSEQLDANYIRRTDAEILMKTSAET